MKNNKLIFIGLSLISVVVVESCLNQPHSQKAEGEELAKTYCSRCHLYASPDLLDSITWIDHVLPKMAKELGINVIGKHTYFKGAAADSSSAISYKDWKKVVDYYKKLAPKKLKPFKRPVPIQKDDAIFKVEVPREIDTNQSAATTFVKIDSIRKKIYSGGANSSEIYSWGMDMQPEGLKKLPDPPVNIYLGNDEMNVVTSIGIMNGTGWPNGKLLSFNLKDEKDEVKELGEGLRRPVDLAPGDFNRDGLMDWVVCSFGHKEGGLYLFQQGKEHQFKKRAIRTVPGAEQVVVGDFNHDGWLDIMALFAQAEEGVWLFLNDKKGNFKSENVLRFPPVYGSTSFQVVDFNGDGLPDIVYTCGDNGDFSQILKPYHGVYIFLNQGNFKFKQAYFYPIDGCTKAMAADFDKDGDLDIATIAFYTDFKNHPLESFIYFEQDRSMHFIPHALPIQKLGRWICMDVGDVNGDGYPDIALGNFARGFVMQKGFSPDWNKNNPLIVLLNQQKDKSDE